MCRLLDRCKKFWVHAAQRSMRPDRVVFLQPLIDDHSSFVIELNNQRSRQVVRKTDAVVPVSRRFRQELRDCLV